mmetsp:Transcript_27932/g.69012  ORF Transcript_27932/g.69012 Transcript_27932/m.69012 type:complete len:315 (-) Transcript_27932:60-1004(-)
MISGYAGCACPDKVKTLAGCLTHSPATSPARFCRLQTLQLVRPLQPSPQHKLNAPSVCGFRRDPHLSRLDSSLGARSVCQQLLEHSLDLVHLGLHLGLDGIHLGLDGAHGGLHGIHLGTHAGLDGTDLGLDRLHLGLHGIHLGRVGLARRGDVLAQRDDAALPRVGIVVAAVGLLGLNAVDPRGEEGTVGVVEALLEVDNQLGLLLQAARLGLLLRLLPRVAHQRDEHVEAHDVDQEGVAEEEAGHAVVGQVQVLLVVAQLQVPHRERDAQDGAKLGGLEASEQRKAEPEERHDKGHDQHERRHVEDSGHDDVV